MNRLTKLLILIVFSLSANFAKAQKELSLHFLQEVWQSNLTNPAIMTDDQYTINVPSFYYNSFNTNSSYNDLFRKNGEGKTILNVSNLLSNLRGDNFTRANLELQTFSFAYRLGNFQLGIGHAFKANGFFDYPSSLPKLIWQGNGQFIDAKVSLAPNLQLNSYHEFALTAAYGNENFSIGVRAKYLNGIGEISTVKGEASLYTDPIGFGLSFETDLDIRSTAVLDIENLTDFNFSIKDVPFDRPFTMNTGFAFDIGVQVQLGDKFKLSASALDIGNINWKQDVKNYQSNGSFTYDGLDITDIIDANSISFEGTLDTLDRIFSFEENNNPYSTKLPAKYYLSGIYQLDEVWQLGAMFHGLQFGDEFLPAFALSGRAKINDMFSVGGTYTIRNNTFFNIGLNLTFHHGPVQFYAVTDNIIGAVTPYSSLSTNGRVGLGLVF